MSYIEREALREELRHCCIVAFDERSGEPYVIDIPQLLRRTTVSADVAPVAHGSWVKNNDSFQTDDYYCCYFDYSCSECGEVVNDRYKLPKYCPNCGARMDGNKNG